MAHPAKQGNSFSNRQQPAKPPVVDETNYFGSDDDEFWDNLKPEDIKGAETEALNRQSQWQATQATQRQARQPSPNYIDDGDDDEVTEVPPPAPVIERLPSRPEPTAQQPPYRPPSVAGRVLNQPLRYPATGGVAPTPSQNNPQYKRPVPLFNTTNGGWTPSQQYTANRQVVYPLSSQSQTSFRTGTQQGYTPAPVGGPTTAQVDSDDVETLRKQLEEVCAFSIVLPPGFKSLANQFSQLRQEKDALNSKLLAKSGEVSLVRSNAERSAKEHEAALTALRLQNQEQAAKQQKAIEDAKRAEQARASELEFTKRDLAEEARKLKEAERRKTTTVPLRDGGATGPGTPTKNSRQTSFRDGFDDEEIAFVSPSKLKAAKSAQSSPRKIKRKRKAVDSPLQALEVEQESAPTVEKSAAEQELAALQEQVAKLRVPDERLEFLEAVLDHRIDNNHQKSMEEFTKFALPGNTKESFASIILGGLPAITQKSAIPRQGDDSFYVQVVNLFLDLWNQCKNESYMEPLPLLLDIITYAIELRTSEIAPFVLSHLLLLAQETALLIANPLFRHKPPPSFASSIEVQKILELLHLVLVGCLAADTGEPLNEDGLMNGGLTTTNNFWMHMRIEFVLTMLSLRQPMEQFGMVCRMLSLSVRHSSSGSINYIGGGFGPIQDADTEDVSAGLLDRMSYLLTEVPSSLQIKKSGSAGKLRGAMKGKQKSSKELARLRLQILTTLRDFSMVPTGARHIVEHKMVIARIATCLTSTLDALYGYPAHHRVLAAIINMSVSLLHYLVFAFPTLDIRQKLSVVQGGFGRYQLTMARINAAERSISGGEEDSQETRTSGESPLAGEREEKIARNVLLGGVKEQMMDMAQRLLEECVTMEEGEEMEAVFP